MGIQVVRVGGNFEFIFCISKRVLYVLEEYFLEFLRVDLDSGNIVKFVGVKWLKGFLSLFQVMVKSIRLIIYLFLVQSFEIYSFFGCKRRVGVGRKEIRILF